MSVWLQHQAVLGRREKVWWMWHFQVGAGLLLLIALVTRVWIRIETTDLGYDLGREHEKMVQLDMERRELELQLSVLTRKVNLARQAKDKLGLVPLQPNQAWKIQGEE